MILVLSGQPPSVRACTRWAPATPTSAASGPPDAVHDWDEAHVHRHPSEEPRSAFDRVRERLFAYDIFPPRFMRFRICPPGPVRVDSLIVQRAGLGWVRLESAVRVVEVWDREDDGGSAAGFRYLTLTGHPECGAASFQVTLDRDDRLSVILEARSRAGTLLARLGRPVARRIQRAATRAALRRLTAN